MTKIKKIEEVLLSKKEQNALKGGVDLQSELNFNLSKALNPLCKGIQALSVSKPIGPFPEPVEPKPPVPNPPPPSKCSGCNCSMMTPSMVNGQLLYLVETTR
ncbi:MAG: hypothetical protein LBN23_00665 [Paludibacter sp.]|jgi:hypothetical protein|nr:hypothetical protein [Paludibacter sp.]